MHIKVQFVFVCIFLALQQSIKCEESENPNSLKSANNDNNHSNNSSANLAASKAINATKIPITKYQIITTNSTELAKKQWQEAEEQVKSNKKNHENSPANHESNEKLSRKITPTDNSANGNDKTQFAVVKQKESIVGLDNSNKNAVLASNGTIPKNGDVKMVAENVASSNKEVQVAHTDSSNNQQSSLNKTNTSNEKTEIVQTPNTQFNNTNSTKASTNTNTNSNATTTSVLTTASTTTTTTTTTSTTTTTTTTTTPKPKKPLVAYGTGDIQDPEPELHESSKLPVEPPHAQPSQELNSNFSYHNNGRDYIVPMMTVIFTVPLAIGIIITAYRRFKDFWSTRHYRRMDFLVDGMYND